MPEEELQDENRSDEYRFWDVFLSYSHDDKDRVEALANRIKELGYNPFHDLGLADLRDIASLDQNRMERLRDILSRSTCLIFCHSGHWAEDASVWTPWELGFFDGAVSSRIGIFLLDGEPEPFDPGQLFDGIEYLRLYPAITDALPEDSRVVSLEDFLAAHAARSRRIDNVRSAFVWAQHLREEMLANPANVCLGVTEWWLSHMARVMPGPPGTEAEMLRSQISEFRSTSVDALRLPWVDAWLEAWAPLPQHADDASEQNAAPGPAPAPWMAPWKKGRQAGAGDAGFTGNIPVAPPYPDWMQAFSPWGDVAGMAARDNPTAAAMQLAQESFAQLMGIMPLDAERQVTAAAAKNKRKPG